MKVYVVTVIFGKRFPSYDVIGVFKKKPTELQISQYGIEYSNRCEGGVSSVDWYEFEIEEDNQNERAKNTNPKRVMHKTDSAQRSKKRG